MLEHYSRNRPGLQYRLTAKSFRVVARTFAWKTSRRIQNRRDSESSTKPLCNLTQTPTVSEDKSTTTQPGLVSEGPPPAQVEPLAMSQSVLDRDSKPTPTLPVSANPPPNSVESTEKNDANHLGLIITSGGFKVMVLAGLSDVLLTAVEKSREGIDAFKTCFYTSEA